MRRGFETDFQREQGVGGAAIAVGDDDEAAGAVGELRAEREALEIDEAGGAVEEQDFSRRGASRGIGQRRQTRGVGGVLEIGEVEPKMQAARAKAALQHDEAAVGEYAQIRDTAAGTVKAEGGGFGAPGVLGGGAELRVEPLEAHERARVGGGKWAVGNEGLLVGDPELLRRVAPRHRLEAEIFARLREDRWHRQPLGARLAGPETQHGAAGFGAEVKGLRGGDVGHALEIPRVRGHRNGLADFTVGDAPGGGVDFQRERDEDVRMIGNGAKGIAARPYEPTQVGDGGAFEREAFLAVHAFDHGLSAGRAGDKREGADAGQHRTARGHKPPHPAAHFPGVVGLARFELATSSTRTKRSTKLSHSPKCCFNKATL